LRRRELDESVKAAKKSGREREIKRKGKKKRREKRRRSKGNYRS